MLDAVKVVEWAWNEGITILAVLEARESLQTRAVERCEGLANSTDGRLVECRSHHEGLMAGLSVTTGRTSSMGKSLYVCYADVLVVNKQSEYISIDDHNTRRMSVMVK